jgi:hypothetical protein
MTGVRRRDSKSTRQRRPVAHRLITNRRADSSVESTAALLKELPGPILWECHGESDAIGLAIATGTAIDHAVDAAMCRQIRPGRSAASSARRAFDHTFRARNLQLHARRLEL